MTEVTIKNFQSIKKVSFKIEGLTVIVGKNNIGKSAIIRAIEAALTNQTGAAFIRNGESSTEVNIKRNDLEIEWTKDTTTASYKINKKPFSKLKGAIPKPLIDAGFEKMEIGDQKIFPLVASQFEPLFLINKPGPVITEVLASLYNINTLGIADDLCYKALRSQKILLKTREKDLEDLQKKLIKFKDFEEIKKTVLDLIIKEKEFETLKNQVIELLDYEQKILILANSLKVLKGIKKINIPDISKLEEELLIINKLKEMEDSYYYLTQSLKKLQGITSVTIPETILLETSIEDISQITEWENIIITISNKLKQEELFNTIKIDNTLIEQISILLEDYKNFCALEDWFMGLARTAKDLREQLKTVTTEYDRKSKELEKNVCPTCGRPF